MFCTNCGKELPENALFCPSCGKSIFLSPATSPVSSQTTPIADINQQNTMSSPLEPSPSAMNFATVKSSLDSLAKPSKDGGVLVYSLKQPLKYGNAELTNITLWSIYDI